MAIIHIDNEDDFKKKVEDSDKVSVIDFWAPWCGPCKMLAPVFEAVSQDSELKNVNFVKIDVDEVQDVAIKFSIMSIPTLLVIKNGEVVDQQLGAMGPDQLKAFVKRNL